MLLFNGSTLNQLKSVRACKYIFLKVIALLEKVRMEGDDDDDLNTMSKENLIILVEKLAAEVEEQNETISDQSKQLIELQRKNPGNTGKVGNKNVTDLTLQLADRETEIGRLKEKLINEQSTTTKLKDENADLRAKLTLVENEKRESETELRRVRVTVDELEHQLYELKESSRIIDQKSSAFNVQKKESQKQQLQLSQ